MAGLEDRDVRSDPGRTWPNAGEAVAAGLALRCSSLDNDEDDLSR